MPQATLAGHPLHPQLIVMPAALIPFSLVMDYQYRMTCKESYRSAAYYCLVGGFVGGLAAGTAGAIDYLSIPSGTQLKRIANTHAILNLSLVALTGVNLLLRRRSTGPLPLLLSAASVVGLFVSGWYGGHMVYEHGMRVKGENPIAGAKKIEMPGDQKLEHAIEKVEQVMPDRGPVVHTNEQPVQG